MSGYRIKPAVYKDIGTHIFDTGNGKTICVYSGSDSGVGRYVLLELSPALALREWLDSVIEEVKS